MNKGLRPAPPNTRVQRTRSSPSAPTSPLTRYPLGARRWFAAAVASLFVVSMRCQAAGAAQQNQEAQVRAALTRFIEAFNNLDWEAFRGSLAADATLFNPEIPEVSNLGRI